MVLNQLKQIRDELKNSAEVYDRAFKNTALIAAQELIEQNYQNKNILLSSNSNLNQLESSPNLNKEYFLAKYGSLKNAKLAYQKIYGDRKYGRSWSEFLAVAKQLADFQLPKEELTLEARISKIEAFLQTLGYEP